MKMILEIKKEKRLGSDQRTARDFIEFFVDGKSLRKLLNTDNITGLGWGEIEEQKKYILQLQKMEESELQSKRIPLYVCAECGDLGCGAITIEIQKEPGKIIWSKFGYENNYEEDIKCLDIYSKIGPFEFEEMEYTRLLEGVIQLEKP